MKGREGREGMISATFSNAVIAPYVNFSAASMASFKGRAGKGAGTSATSSTARDKSPTTASVEVIGAGFPSSIANCKRSANEISSICQGGQVLSEVGAVGTAMRRSSQEASVGSSIFPPAALKPKLIRTHWMMRALATALRRSNQLSACLGDARCSMSNSNHSPSTVPLVDYQISEMPVNQVIPKFHRPS